MTQTPQFTFCRASAGKALAIAADIDEMDAYYPFCRFCWFQYDAPPGSQWGDEVLDVRVQGIALYARPEKGVGRQFVLLSSEGDIVFIEDPKNHVEKIKGAGIESPDSRFYGRMASIRTIGFHLYACGEGGQVYMRQMDGDWKHLDTSILQDPRTPLPRKWLCNSINGPTENEIYICGFRGLILFWDGVSIRQLDCPSDADLGDIVVEDAKTIWICGSRGTLLVGNAWDGFKPAPGVTGRSLFQSITYYENKLYLAASAGAPRGLFVYHKGFLRRVQTGVQPDIEDPHIVDSQHGVLWALSTKDIFRHDGLRWERINFPPNRPIR